MKSAKISERGNGLGVTVGDEIYEPVTDTIYRVLSVDGPIHTGAAGDGNYVWATVADTGRGAGDCNDAEWESVEDNDYDVAVAAG